MELTEFPDILWNSVSQPIIVHQSKSGLSKPILVDPVQSLQQLRALLHTRPDVAFFRTDCEFLRRFLKVRKYRIDEAFYVLCRYFNFRHQNRDLCVGLSVNGQGVQAALLDGTVGVLPHKDPCGRPILVVLASNWDYSRYDVKTVYQAVLVTLEHLVQELTVQDTGIIAIVDWSHFPSKLARSLSPRTLRLFLDGLQDSFPLRLGALHVVSPPWYVEAALGLARPFLKEKLKERIFVHGNNLHALHATIPPRLLPAELGGERGEYHALNWASTIIPEKMEHKTIPVGKHSTGGFSASFDISAASPKEAIATESTSLRGSLLQIS